MNRRKEDEKMMGPMFPRLHVNDTIEKGGPRAPPRNKMALYEQLSIPSQRFNSGFNPNHNTLSATSSTQGSENKRPMLFPVHPARSAHQVDNLNTMVSETSLAAPQKKLNEEDFTVPVFVQPENGQNIKNSDSLNQENVSLCGPPHILCSPRNQSTCNKEPQQDGATCSNSRQKDICQTEKPQCQPEDWEDGVCFTKHADRLQSTNYASLHEVLDGSQLQNESNAGYCNDKTGYSLRILNGDRCDNDSDTYMLNSVSGMDISPDDVVAVIGQKHFWKARGAIVNQQRVFAVQVFELHRLIKVQRLFAGSPNVLFEDTSYSRKPIKSSIPKELSLAVIIKPSANIEKHKVQPKNPSEKPEESAGNSVVKSSLCSSQNISRHHPSNQIPLSSNPQPTTVTADRKTNPLYFNQPTIHHWWVPVVSPTEGLIYKPYPGPGLAGLNPMTSNFSNPPYGIPNLLAYFQGMGVPPSFPSMSHAYFPPYAMSSVGPAISGSAIDQGNHFMGTNFSVQQYKSCNGSTQKKNKPDAQGVVETHICKESEVQVSMVSSSGEGRNGPQLFPNSTADYVVTENPARVIKVVPHNAVSANETAFRIFQSIQKEREQYESI